MSHCVKPNIPRLLLVGRGSIGRKHERNASALGAQVVTVDPNPEREAEFQSIAQAVASCGNDYFSHAVIAAPVAHHCRALLQLVRENIPAILVEKPLVLPEELELVKNLSLSGQTICVGFNWRFNTAVQQLKQEISQGAIGKIQVAQLWAREWLPQYGGHVVLESGSHILDTARYLLGELKVMGAYVSHHGMFGDADEAASFLLESETGVHVLIHVNFIHAGSYDYTITIQGQRGSLTCQPERFEDMHLQELDAFLHGKRSILATLTDGVRNMELLQSILVPTPVVSV